MAILSKVWNKFKDQPDVWFFYGFLITFPLTIRKVLTYYPIRSQFNEWSGVYLYLSDIFLVLALIFWIINILRNNNGKLSIATTKLWLKKAIIILPLILVLWSFISILWSENQNIALFRAIKLLEFYFLYLYIIFRIIHPASILPLPRGGSKGGVVRNTFLIIIALGFIQAAIGIGQFIIQHSIGLFWLKESLISPDISGVAKIILDGEKFIRAYGLLPHPNILGGFLLLSIILTWTYSKIFHPVNSDFVPHGTKSENGASMEHLKISRGETLLYIILTIQIVALVLTFSKSAIIGLIIALGYLWCKFNKNKEQVFHPGSNVPRGTYYGTSVKQLVILFSVILLIAGIWLYLANLNLDAFLFKSLDERLSVISVPRETSSWSYLGGFGVGQSVVELVKQAGGRLEAWQYQPIHNIFWLIQAELGFVGLFIFLLFLWKILCPDEKVPRLLREGKLFHIEQFEFLRGGTFIFKGILIGFIFIMFFDHYLWDIQQGQIMLWMILGLIAGIKNKSG